VTGLYCWLLQTASDPVGPAGWNFRNVLGLVCQVVGFVLVVAFIFWLADLKNAGPEVEDTPAGAPSKPDTGEGTPEPPKPDEPEASPEQAPEDPSEPSAPPASSEPPPDA
jgi:hypothetical protein